VRGDEPLIQRSVLSRLHCSDTEIPMTPRCNSQDGDTVRQSYTVPRSGFAGRGSVQSLRAWRSPCRHRSFTFIKTITAQGSQAVIPPRSNRLNPRAFDRHIYKDRNLVECFFCRIKQFRRIATRYDKLTQLFLSFVEALTISKQTRPPSGLTRSTKSDSLEAMR